MKQKLFVTQLDKPRILAAIRIAEGRTSGEICVFVSSRQCPDPLDAAERHFQRLKYTQTQYRNGILIFVAPQSQTFALYGDVGIHEKCGPEFWQAVRDEMIPHLQASRYSDAIVHAVDKVGELLATHFPIEAGDKNELSDKIERD